MLFVPRSSHVHPLLWEDSGSNSNFLAHLFRDQAIIMQFLMDVGLLWRKMQCNTCGRDDVVRRT